MKADRKQPHAIATLNQFVAAAQELVESWGLDTGYLDTGYPKGLPSFDELTHALVVWRDAAVTAASDNLQATADRVIQILRERGVGTVWEFPGYIHVSVCPSVGLSLALGIDGDVWIGNTIGPDGDVLNRWGSWEPEPMPITSKPEAVATMLVKARGEFLDRVRTALGLTCPTCGQKRDGGLS